MDSLTDLMAAPISRCRGRCSPLLHQALIRRSADCLEGGGLVTARRKVRTRNTTLYRFRAEDSQAALKINDSKSLDEIRCEYRTLEELHACSARRDGIRVPQPMAFFEGCGGYLLEYVDSGSLRHALTCAEDRGLPAASEACGEALAEIHDLWRTRGATPDVDEAVAVAGARRRPISAILEGRAMKGALEVIAGHEAPQSRLYLDFDPANILLPPGGPVLLDPPEREVVGPVHWDLAVFAVGVERGAWSAYRPSRTRSARVRSAIIAFRRGYLARSGMSWTAEDEVLLTVCEMLRLAQLARWAMAPWASHDRVRRTLRAGPTAGLLGALALSKSSTLARLVDRLGLAQLLDP